jgi:hypothetical protein
MPTKIIQTITVTGADDSVQDIGQLFEISKEFPRVEWGILVSRNNMGHSRFPSLKWIETLADMCHKNPDKLNLSAHICGKWVREIFLEGKTEIFDVLPMDIFKRVQFNFHASKHQVNEKALTDLLVSKFHQYELIFQFDGVNEKLIAAPILVGLNAYSLFDKSGGAGILPNEWPRAHRYSGYAGGLSPENVVEQLEKINVARNNYLVWIDAETKLRTEDDKIFELDKVKEFLKNSYPWSL